MYQLLETICIKNGFPCHLNYHQQRMDESIILLFGTKNHINLQKELVIPEFTFQGLWKCRLIYQRQIESISFEPYQKREITSLKVIVNDKIDYSLKYYDRTSINQLSLQKGHCDDILIVKNNLIADTSYSNICFFKDDKWFTPTTPLLNGTCRKRLLDEKIIIAKHIYVEEIFNYKYFMLINAMLDFNTEVIQQINNQSLCFE